MEKKIIVTGYNTNLEWLKMTYEHGFSPDNIVIYDRSDQEVDWSHIGKSIRDRNIGTSEYVILSFIIDNYDNLPDINIFILGHLWDKPTFPEKSLTIKGNYYTTKERFVKGLYMNELYSLWVDKWLSVNDFRHLAITDRKTVDNGLVNMTLNWSNFELHPKCETRFFGNPFDLWDWCFVNPPKPDRFLMVPGNNIVVPKDCILKYNSPNWDIVDP